MKTVIMAGGHGTRLGALSSQIPKPMLKIEGKPILEHQIDCLRAQGFTDIILTVSYLGHLIKDYFKDGKQWGVSIHYFEESVPMGNAGALFQLQPYLEEDFLLLNADIIFQVDLKRFVSYHYQKGGWITLFAYANNHPQDSGLIITDDDNRVTQWFTKEDVRPTWYKNCVNGGIHLVSPLALEAVRNHSAFPRQTEGGIVKIDLDRQILKPLCKTGKIFCYKSPEYVQDMGTPERYASVCEDVKTGRVQSKQLTNPQCAIFLDRDSMMNHPAAGKYKLDDFELRPQVARAIRKINEAGYLAIVLAKQPMSACTPESSQELVQFHNKMETLLGKEGAYIDQIYISPSSFTECAGELSKQKTACPSGKTEPNVLQKAAKDFHIDLTRSWFVGTNQQDVQVAKSAGCKTGLIGSDSFGASITASSLAEIVAWVLEPSK